MNLISQILLRYEFDQLDFPIFFVTVSIETSRQILTLECYRFETSTLYQKTTNISINTFNSKKQSSEKAVSYLDCASKV